MKKRAAPKDREYLEGLNLKQLQKGSKPSAGQDKREFYQELQEQAKEGPLFAPKTLSLVDRLPELPKPVTKWLGVLAMHSAELDKVNPGDLVNIIRWVRESTNGGTQIAKMSWDVAVDAAQDFDNHGDTPRGKFQQNKVVYKFKDGWTIVELETKHDITLEGKLVQNCLRDPSHDWFGKVESGGTKLYSLRTPANSPRVDIEVRNGSVQQCFGKQNQPPIDKYNKYLVEFFDYKDLLDGVRHLSDISGVPPELWAKIARHENLSVRRTAAENPETPAAILDILATDSSSDVREYVASNESASGATLGVLAKDSFWAVRSKVAINPSTPGDVLKVLAQDSSVAVREYVAHNPSTPVDMLKVLANDTDWSVRRGVAHNPSTPIDVANELAQDSDTKVRKSVARNRSTAASILRKLAQDSDVEIRQHVASNTATPVDTLRLLVQDSNDGVRFALACNTSAPEDVLLALSKDQMLHVQFAAKDTLKKVQPKTTAAVKDREYLEGLNLKQLQKTQKPAADQDKREFYQELQEQAKSGPLFSTETLDMVKNLPELPKHVTKWLGNLSKGGLATIDPRGLNLIVDWARGDTESTKIQHMTWDQAMAAQQAWHESTFEIQDTGEYQTKDVVQNLGGGWTMVKIDNEHDLDVEGNLMGHCVGGDNYWQAVQNGHSTIYSLRDPSNHPHVTIEVDNDTMEVAQCFGKQNQPPVQKYNKYLIAFFKKHNLMDGIIHLADTSGISESVWMDLLKAKPHMAGHVAYAKGTPAPVLDYIAHVFKNDPTITRYLELNKNTASYTLNFIADNHKHQNIALIIQNPNVGEKLMHDIVASGDADDIEMLLKSPHVPPSILALAAKCEQGWLRAMVALHPNVTQHILKGFLNDKSHGVAEVVGGSLLATHDMLDTLARHKDYTVRNAVAANPHTSAATLDYLSTDTDRDVRWHVANNTNTSRDTLNKLLQDSVSAVAQRAEWTLEKLDS